jgi:SAM-dependent methyltransferase
MLDVAEIAPNLVLDRDGIWRSAQREAISYPEEGNEACYQIEESSFWFRHRNACIEAAVKAYPPRSGGLIFDVGGGNGFVALGLIRAGFETVLVEPGPAGAMNGKRRGIPTVICATTTAAGIRPSTLDAVGLFDVIEHTEDDMAFLASMRALLKKDGRLYATVPAYPALWSGEDVSAGHFRRYTRKSIAARIEQSGFRVEYSTYIFRPLPLPIFLLRALPHRLGFMRGGSDPASDHGVASTAMASVMNLLLSGEVSNVGARRRMIFGGSCLLVASAA